jgi:hypothetical protein
MFWFCSKFTWWLWTQIFLQATVKHRFQWLTQKSVKNCASVIVRNFVMHITVDWLAGVLGRIPLAIFFVPAINITFLSCKHPSHTFSDNLCLLFCHSEFSQYWIYIKCKIAVECDKKYIIKKLLFL